MSPKCYFASPKLRNWALMTVLKKQQKHKLYIANIILKKVANLMVGWGIIKTTPTIEQYSTKFLPRPQNKKNTTLF